MPSTPEEPRRRRCRLCEGRIEADGRCASCGTKSADTDVKLPGPAEHDSLGPYDKIRYYDEKPRRNFNR